MEINELEYAKSILNKEIAGLNCLIDNLGQSFIEAIDLLYKKNGHVILSGMGKPGHVCVKIAATLASTGTPAFFLHPGEASHGDLGMISADDTLFVFSWSGNTVELVPMLSYANRFGIDVIGVTSNPDSTLAKASTIKIILPKVEEAGPHKLAPTTTTTMMLALGDAVALCLLKRKEFKKEQFKNLHPGGSLGKNLLMVRDLMHTNTPIVHENDLMKSVLIEMTSKSYGCACVVDKTNKIIGVITDGDLRRNILVDFLDMKACEVMSKHPKLISAETFAQEAIKIMNDNKITNLFVSENGTPEGIIHIHDCLRAGIA
ncbi:MAG: KpsF/GutQ family sugar-phosphate isomerase [Alphaproteobacteria bacterium]|nr:KpsF/GutQ family sugar-phosphate isomerase [Alphaproteobacteria bacterium]